MTISGDVAYPNFDYSLNAYKLLHTKDGDIDEVIKSYNITKKELAEMMDSIREWYEKQPHLPKGQLHDRMIIGHMMTRGFSVEQTKEKIDNYFAARHKMPDILNNWEPLPANMAKYLKQGFWIVPPYRTKENHRVIIFRVVDPTDLCILDVSKIGFLMGAYRVFNETTQGDHWVFDFEKVTLNHVYQFNPLLISKIYYHVTSCYALKLKGIHLINVPPFAQSVLALVKRIMKAKHVARLHIYDSFEKIFNVLPKEVFPKEMGGTEALTCQEICDNWYETFQSESWRHYSKHSEKYFITDESKRLMSVADGLEGSFRKLEVD